MIKPCSKCREVKLPATKYQNEKYGEGMRVHNPQGAKNKDKCRCTVCGDTKSK